jgi:hypothetical protein
MDSKKILEGLFCLALLFWSALLAAQSKNDWLTRTSKHFEIHYQAYQQDDADQLLLQAERIHSTLAPFVNKAPEVTHIVLRDHVDIPLTFASNYHGYKIEMFLTPSDHTQLELAFLKDWRYDILLHEYSHILNQHAIDGGSWPRFLLEGFAVYMESQNSRESGRLNSSLYQMIMRQEVASGHFKAWRDLGITNLDWPFNKQYVYGAFFTEYLINTYGEQAYCNFLKQTSAAGLDAAELKEVFGKDFYALWQDFKQAMLKRFKPEIQAHQAFTEKAQIKTLLKDVQEPWAFVQKHQLYSSMTDARANRRLARYASETGSWAVVDDFPKIISADSHPSVGLLAIGYAQNDLHSASSVLKLYQNQKWRTLSQLTHIHHARWLPDGQHIVGIQVQKLQASILLIDPAHPEKPETLWQGSKDEVLGQFAVDPSGRYLMIQHQHTGSPWNLMQFDLQAKTWTPVTDTQFIELNPVYKDADHLLFSADYDGIFNIYELDLKTRRLTQYTDVQGGAFAPLWDAHLGLIYRAYGTEGYELQQWTKPKPLKTTKQPIQTRKVLHQRETPLTPTAEETSTFSESEPYSPWRSLAPQGLIPLIFSTSHEPLTLGFMLFEMDTLNQHQYMLLPTFDFQHGYLNLDANYSFQQEWLIAGTVKHRYYDVEDLDFGSRQYDKEIRQLGLKLEKRGLLLLDSGRFHTKISSWYHSEEVLNSPEKSLNPPEKALEFNQFLGLTLNNRWSKMTSNPFYPGSRSGWDLGLVTSYVYATEDQEHIGVTQASFDSAINLTRSTNLTAGIRSGYSTSESQGFLLGGTQGSNSLESRRLNLHGYASEHAKARAYVFGKLELNQRLLHLDSTFGLGSMGSGNIYGSTFTEAAQAWLNQDHTQTQTLASVGVSLTYELADDAMRLPLKVSYAKGLTMDAPDHKVDFEFSFNF